jgi:multidrug efflux pump subunit AcrA (membrane-fusion protein)
MQNTKYKIQNAIVLFSGILVFLFVTGCQRKVEEEKIQEAIPVKVEKVGLRDLSKTLEYVGNIEAEDEAVVYPKVGGKVIEKVKKDGDAVAKGEAVVYIDRDEVGLKFEKAPVESPLTGIVGRVYVNIGENVASLTPIALVVNMDKVKIVLDIPERYLPRVALDQEAKILVDAYPNEEFMGKVTKISPIVNLENRAAPIEIMIDNPGHLLKSGMFAKVNLIIEEHKDVPVILKEAVLGKEPDLYVFTVKNNKAFRRKVVLGLQQGPYVEVTAGLEAGDLAVIMGQQRLRDAGQVEVEEER